MKTPVLLQAKSFRLSSWIETGKATRLVISGRTEEDVFEVFTRRGSTILKHYIDGETEIPLPPRAEQVRISFVSGPSTVDVDLE